jgi:hypothetical protein
MVYRKIYADVKLAAMRLYEQNILTLDQILDCVGFSERTFWRVWKIYGLTGDVEPPTCSAWKSSPKTGKRPRLDWTKTAEDRKFPGPSKTATAVRSSVSNNSGNFKTDKRPV